MICKHNTDLFDGLLYLNIDWMCSLTILLLCYCLSIFKILVKHEPYSEVLIKLLGSIFVLMCYCMCLTVCLQSAG